MNPARGPGDHGYPHPPETLLLEIVASTSNTNEVLSAEARPEEGDEAPVRVSKMLFEIGRSLGKRRAEPEAVVGAR